MAEVGRAALRDPGALLPGGFWAAVAVWLERPQVANKRLCGARLEARRSAALRLAEARGPRPLAGPEQEERGAAGHGPEEELGPGQRSPDEGPGPRPLAGPEEEERGAAGRGSEEGPGPGRRSAEEGPGPRPSAGLEQGMAGRGRQETQGPHQQGEARREAAEAPLLAVDPGHPDKARGREDDFAVADLDLLWDNFSRSLASGNPEMLAFLLRSGTGLQPEEQHELDVVFRTVIPKTSPHCQLTSPRREIVVQDVLGGAVTFLPLEEDDEGNLKVKMSNVYQIQLSHSREEWFISVLIFCPERWHSDGIVYPKPTWLGEELLGRLAKWSVEDKKSEFKSTLSLISIMKYSKVYQELKEKYKEMVKVWPEVTDPEKFVYEDVAIATYLLILWDEERAESGITAKQSFVDLGCGNGLLVHILSSEGHPGRGIDVRRRKIWDMYGPQTQLEEGAITPNNETLFPDVDWLIGNHSDELTPWIPVIAARSSYSCRFFILPCCFFDFIGKYHRRQSKKTQYREYLDFITEVGSTCGFRVEEDCLRIPSTKRVCLIGKSRTYPPTGEVFIDEQRTQYINSRRGHPVSHPGREPAPAAAQLAANGAGHRDGHGAVDAGVERVSEAQAAERKAGPQAEGLWLPGFHPREKAECTRNCASLPRDFIDQVVLQVANLLLGGKQLDPRSSQNGSLESWHGGESLSLAEVARELDKETLQRLKRECGGLQTLLRNSHQVFEVQNGRVHIRDWREERLRKKTHPEAKRRLFSDALKTRICWFFTHHPDGCPLPSDCCPFAHGPGELRPSQTPKKKKQSL
ncbi:PREDICTED: probable tRNA (uracil-O(2)-)-methyltransferase [Galeopterus variegatus]|uniref:Probable tRNA (uracil-O(2)-)-methyltransferase n=1 Tax=Galeopterus variegatus TaxID=482537 RepID=A0ABM0R8N0_GALVR|nr:PREDICTED: probable tRNA (uracil-O(2)-)-methyltransferase [Galeopterus variegatus]